MGRHFYRPMGWCLLKRRYQYFDSCSYFEPPVANLANEILDGVMGAVTNGTAAAGLTTAGISYTRQLHFDMMDSFFRRSYLIVIHQDHLISVPASQFIAQALHQMMSHDVWLLTVVVMVTFLILGISTEHVTAMTKFDGATPHCRLNLVGKWCFHTFGFGIGAVGIEDLERTKFSVWPKSKIIFLTTFLLYGFVISVTITGRLPDMFAFDHPRELPFSDIPGLLASNFSVYGTPIAVDLLSDSMMPAHKILARQIQLLPYVPSTRLGYNFKRYQQYNELARKEKTALIVNQETLLEMAYLNCDMYVAIDDVVMIQIAGLILSKNSSLRELLMKGYLQAQQNGAVQASFAAYNHYIKIRTHAKTRCPRGNMVRKRSVPRLHAVRLEDLAFLYYVLGGSLFASLLSFILEHFCMGRSAT
ncbi:hypothetical protein BV898_08280 [Hypsibius exemplaris]|uniref:Ionotropic glutamate receptor C-terminal domain-containing protein n=1 Tax=Hypsibius exemplaris TaxID=2072580 RepID=A0A1W0WR70_HYPEX|nr:hypothetical protein BV898_08280 [Hypsibius exemplaris]